jgi:hypothetical protein
MIEAAMASGAIREKDKITDWASVVTWTVMFL